MLRLFHIVLVLGNRVKILKLPLYSIQFLHQITTGFLVFTTKDLLYSIQFLHQITTLYVPPREPSWLYSIQFLHQITTWDRATSARRPLYSIQFLHQITTNVEKQCRLMGCIVSNFYIKSQPDAISIILSNSCIVSNFYIKSQQLAQDI